MDIKFSVFLICNDQRTWQKKYYALYKASNYAVERVEMFDSEEAFIQNSSRKIIPLNECIKVAQSPQKHQQNVFDVSTIHLLIGSGFPVFSLFLIDDDNDPFQVQTTC